MKRIESLEQAEKVLAGYVPQARELLGKDLTLKRMRPLLDTLDNPQDKLQIIHIAGTSGKTSTAYFVASLLKQTGKKIGLTVSPHIDSVTERIQINLQPLPELEFCEALGEFLEEIKHVKPEPTYFELMIAFVYWYFAKAKVDYAVIETGLGGSFDATNVAGKSDKVCAITDIGVDHMHVLGRTITEIAGQKAGIIHHDNHVFMHQQSPAVMQVFEAECKKHQAILNVLSDMTKNRELHNTELLPMYQQRNWALAFEVYKHIARRDSLPDLSSAQLQRSTMVQIPGRMETMRAGNKTIIMDGAHNQQKMQAFVTSFQALYPNKKANTLLAMKTGKEYEAVLPLLAQICERIVITSFKTSQDMPITSIDPAVLGAAATSVGFESVTVEVDNQAALRKFFGLPGDIGIVTGSFYLLSSLRPDILKAHD